MKYVSNVPRIYCKQKGVLERQKIGDNFFPILKRLWAIETVRNEFVSGVKSFTNRKNSNSCGS